MHALSPTNHRDEVRYGMRRAVVKQVLSAKEAAFAGRDAITCPVTGETITRDSCHVDHAPPIFADLADAFAATEGGYKQIAVTAGEPGEIGRSLAGYAQLVRWQEYHREHARLRVVSKTANLSTLRTGARRGSKIA